MVSVLQPSNPRSCVQEYDLRDSKKFLGVCMGSFLFLMNLYFSNYFIVCHSCVS